MMLSAAQMAQLSRLLDAGLELGAVEREMWLAALPESDRDLVPMLREMFVERDRNRDQPTKHSLVLPILAMPTVESTEGDLVGPYVLLRELGRGGMGSVWLAERADGSFKRQVALKLPRLSWGPGLAERMAREREIGALLEHPNIARLYDAGVDHRGMPYLAFEYVSGRPIDIWCRDRALSVTKRLNLLVQVARAVAYAHGRLVVHRDIKPSNVLVTDDGQIHLLDFGIAKLLEESGAGEEGLTRDLGRVLTPSYASPEQICGEPITVASDVYGLGVLAYEILTGHKPFEREKASLATLEEAVLNSEPTLASARVGDKATAGALRGEVDAILAKSLRREPNRRYPTAYAFADDVQRFLNGERVLAQPDSVWYRLRKVARRHRMAVGAVAAIALALLLGAGVSLWQARRANQEAARTRIVKDFIVDVFKINAKDSPEKVEVRQLPVELLLDRGARLIDLKFAGQPDLQAELYGVVAEILLDVGSTQLAVDYATKHVQALGLIGASPPQVIDGLLRLSEALGDARRLAEAQARATEALQLADGDRELRVRSRLRMAELLLQTERHSEADPVLDLVDADLAAKAALRPGLRARAWYLRAMLLSDTNHFDQARPLYERALEHAIAAEGRSSRLASQIRLRLASDLMQNGHVGLALSTYEQAIAALRALHGDEDFQVALAEADAAYTHAAMDDGAYESAERTLARSQEILDRNGSRIPPWLGARVEAMRGCFAVRFGRVVAGYALLSHATSVIQSSVPHAPPAGTCLGFAAMDTGRHEEAERILLAWLDFHSSGPSGSVPDVAHEYVTLAMNRMMAGRLDSAREALDRAPNIPHVSGATGNQVDAWAKALTVARARIDLESHNYAHVLEGLHGLPDRRYMMNDTGMLRGAALCGLGQASEALPAMYAALRRVEATERYAFSPLLAYWRARVALCALDAGDRAQAAELARLAGEGIAGQTEVSVFFKKPLRVLEARLQGGDRRPHSQH
jgi:serine/threonine-protein kinase